PTLNTKPLFKLMVEKNASDLFFTSNAPIKIKIEGQILPVNRQVLSPDTVRQTALALMSPEQREHFQREWELDFAISEPGLGRVRVNVFMQRGCPAMVNTFTRKRPSPGSEIAKSDRKSTRLNSSHDQHSYAVFCLKNTKDH